MSRKKSDPLLGRIAQLPSHLQPVARRYYRAAAKDIETVSMLSGERTERGFARRDDPSQPPRAMDYLLWMISGGPTTNEINLGSPKTAELEDELAEDNYEDLPQDLYDAYFPYRLLH